MYKQNDYVQVNFGILTTFQVYTLAGIAAAAFAIMYFNPSLPWASPASRRLPGWIQRRIAELPVEREEDVDDDRDKRS
jgi:hypothetical protein